MLVAVFCAVVATFVLDLRAPRTGVPKSWLPLCAAVVAAALPIGAIVPVATLPHVASVPSFDVTHPCVAPADATRLHALGPFVMIRVLLPLAIVVGLARERAAPRPRLLLVFSFLLGGVVLIAALVRTVRGGADVASFRACGALTPEEGSDAARVRDVVRTMVGEGRQEILHWRDLPHLPAPPWVRGEIPITIDGNPWSLRIHRASVIAEPDDPRRANRPLPALHFSSIPSLAVSNDARVLIEHRPDGKLYAVRVGQPVRVDEIGPLLRPPRWPVALMIASMAIAVILFVRSRPRRLLAEVFAPYRTATFAEHRTVLPAFCVLILVEASVTTLHALRPYW